MPTLVPALLGGSVVLALLAVSAFVLAWAIGNWNCRPAPAWCRIVACIVGTCSVLGAAVFVSLAIGFNQQHWNTSCHRIHGQLIGGKCYKPTKEISVP